MRIRRATPEDGTALTVISRATFLETFGDLYEPADLAHHMQHAYATEGYVQALEEQGCAAWLLEDDDGAAQGYVYCGPCGLPHAEVAPGDLELKRLYLRKSVQNGGHGQRLFDTAEAWMRASGPAALWIGVWSENAGAQRFYARQGYHKAGEYLYPVGEARDLEFILRKTL